jgi:homocysteine S-methyltransferase
VLNAIIGPRGDAYRPDVVISTREAEDYFSEQIAWLVRTADMVGGMTFNQASEAAGLVRAARAADMPVAISVTLETDGRLPGRPEPQRCRSRGRCGFGRILLRLYDQLCSSRSLLPALQEADWTRRMRGLRANASRRSH